MSRNPLANHILPASATMVGVCLTAVGLVKILEQRIGPSHVDEFYSLDSVLFLISAMASYISLRTAKPTTMARSETIADWVFMGALVLLVLITVLFAYEGI